MISVGWLAPADKCWDSNMFQLLTNKNGQELYPTGLKFRHYAGFPPNVDGAVVVVPGQYFHQHTDYINDAIAVLDWCLLVRTADEEDLFDAGAVVHPNCRVWVQYPRRDYGDVRVIGVGFPPHFNNLPAEPPEKLLDVFLSGQNTHARRNECFAALKGVEGRVEPTPGFTQGMDPAEYVRCMVGAKVAPAPSGAVSVDSFRFCEALEAHAVPLADAVSPVDGPTNFWEMLFPGYKPFPVYEDAAELRPLVMQTLSDWPAVANRTTAFWMRYKRHLAINLRDDLTELGAL